MKKALFYILIALVLFGLPFIAYTSDEYRGAHKCKVCHFTIYKSWGDTPHAKAFEVLQPGAAVEEKQKAGLDPQKDYSADDGCIGCHTTGNSTQLPGVQCEVCHGPGKGYSRATIMNKKKWKANPESQRTLAKQAGLVVNPPEQLCLECHNEKSPTYKPFSYADRIEEVGHQQ